MKNVLVAMMMLAGMTSPASPEHWRFEDSLSAENAPALAGKAGVFEKGTPPVFDAGTPALKIWNGGTFSIANPNNRRSLRLANEGVAGAGRPTGGDVTVAGTDARTQPADLTVEAFVKMRRQMPRHALIASKRRNGQIGATWSLSIDPEGRLRARFDTQPGADAKSGAGFNQSFGSTGSLTDGVWHHVALTFDHATRSAVLYLDHVRCGGGVTSGPLVYDDGVLVFGRGLDGWLDEVQLTAEVLHPEGNDRGSADLIITGSPRSCRSITR
jgi:hypothetical protein